MKYFLVLFLAYSLWASALAKNSCKIITSNRSGTVRFKCTELKSLGILDRARKNTTGIEISDSKISTISGHTFARFGASLVTLDMHQSGIAMIDADAFIGLTKLERLVLWGNKLRSVPGYWFRNTQNLRTLDLSFNAIEEIRYDLFPMLPLLENFYFDYNQLKVIDFNMFPYMGNLKRVKFGKNPLKWEYRARLTWQLENQRVEYTEEWENWGWMNVVINNCIESGQGELPSETVLDCVAGKLLDLTYDIVSQQTTLQTVGCYEDARRLVACMRPGNATGNSEDETMRKILEDYAAVLTPMTRPQSRFIIKL